MGIKDLWPLIHSAASRRVDVPAAMIAVALQQNDKIYGMNERLGTPPSHIVHVEFGVLARDSSSEFRTEGTNIRNGTGSGQKHRETATKNKRARTRSNERNEHKHSPPMLKYLGIIELTDSKD
ncbi:hypothetical protein EV368DRAFT_69565 [Lentinula lateritia]|nr:hypothetical protein EV368DRAFT_69565 [Lentinula lateritia]